MKNTIQNIAVFDLETTGLIKDKHAIIEIACCPINNLLEDLPEYDSGVIAIYDNRIIQQQALDVNGITRDQISKGRDPKVVLDEFLLYLKKLKVGTTLPILAGHNIDHFDIPFLIDYCELFKVDLSKYVNLKYTIDTMWRGREMWVESANWKHSTCCELAGIELVNAHRAVADTRANKELVKFFIRNMRNVNSGEIKEEKRFRATFQI